MMKSESGDKRFPIWLLGDSNPKNWESRLDFPLDPRHPARHNIWTPIVDVIQEKVFLEGRTRIDMSHLYLRNSIQKADHKPEGMAREWQDNPATGSLLSQDVADLRMLIEQNMPKIVLTFGSFAFEFARRAIERDNAQPYRYWSTKRLGEEFRKRVTDFDVKGVHILPLLHVSIARGRYLESHRDFCAGEDSNYFSFVGTRIGELLLRHYDKFSFWMGNHDEGSSAVVAS